MIKALLAHPLTKGIDIDDPRTTQLRLKIIRQKGFLRQIYLEWYASIVEALPNTDGAVLELGSGGGFMSEFIPSLITSEVFYCANVHAVLDGRRLPFRSGCLGGIVMTNVLHHLSQPQVFFTEATRCVRAGGIVAMIEPWVSSWSRIVYTHLHHEPFDPESLSWELPPSGPLSGGNDALPWIIFERDRTRFERDFSHWRIESIEPLMPFRYLLSGGVSMRSLVPASSFLFAKKIETILAPWINQLAMFAKIVLRRLD
jgi:SAM-dependent methyltransferase